MFGARSHHNVGLIIAQDFNERTGVRERPYQTVKPLADDLGLEVHTDCKRDDPHCIRELVAEFAKRSKKDVLICWVSCAFSHIPLGMRSKHPYFRRRGEKGRQAGERGGGGDLG